MFLNRGDLLEETYFTWSMIPVRGATGDVDGVSDIKFALRGGFERKGRLIPGGVGGGVDLYP